MSRSYQICTRCVMDTTDPEITFDGQGFCNHCRNLLVQAEAILRPDPRELRGIVEKIRKQGMGKPYDCILGMSGGVDSTYLAHLTRALGLRPLAVHLDNGWDSELAVKNIENALNKLGIDLYTHVLDWEEFRSLQVSFLRSSTPDCEIPTDHAIHATLFHAARRHGVRYILQGMNLRTEGIMPKAWTYGAYDWRYIRSVHRIVGCGTLKQFPHFALTDRMLNLLAYRLRVVCPLNYIDYDRRKAMQTIQEELGWRDYGVKHGESVYTRFYQSFILPKKFGVDKRRAHLSSLVVFGQLGQTEALAELARQPYSDELMSFEREYTIKKLGLTTGEFDELLKAAPKSYRDYPNQAYLLRQIGRVAAIAKRLGWLHPTTSL